jgi:hypothetical protein
VNIPNAPTRTAGSAAIGERKGLAHFGQGERRIGAKDPSRRDSRPYCGQRTRFIPGSIPPGNERFQLRGRRAVTTPSVQKRWFAPEGAAITSMDFVRGVGHDWLAVADQGGGLHLIEVDSDKERTLSPSMEAYGLAYVPRRTHPPGLAAVGQRILAFDLSGSSKCDLAAAPARVRAARDAYDALPAASGAADRPLTGDRRLSACMASADGAARGPRGEPD